MQIIDAENLEILSYSVLISFLVSVTMGSLISVFRKGDLDTESQLAEIEKNLKNHKELKEKAQLRKEKIVKTFRFYGFCIFVLLLGGLYLFFPDDFIAEWEISLILAASVFIVYPLLFFISRKICKSYLQRQFKLSDDLIKQLQKEKKEILENVMEKEPYNKAKEILKKYSPHMLISQEIEEMREREKEKNNQELRRRNVPGQKQAPSPSGPVRTPVSKPVQKVNLNATMPVNRVGSPQVAQFASPQARKRPQTVRPLPGSAGNQSKMDKIVGWVTGSNPEQMYALICRNCCEHNGLASKEEFDYLEWRCAYCHFLNKARKERPLAPRLPEQRPMTSPRSSSVSPNRARSRSGRPQSATGRSERSSSISSTTSSIKNVREDSGTESDQMEKPEVSLDETPKAESDHSEPEIQPEKTDTEPERNVSEKDGQTDDENDITAEETEKSEL